MNSGCSRSLALGDLGTHEPHASEKRAVGPTAGGCGGSRGLHLQPPEIAPSRRAFRPGPEAQPAAPQVVADYFPLCRTMILRSLPSNRRPGASSLSRKLPKEAETSRNSLFRRILRGTSLFGRFYSATLPVSQRKQIFCPQNRGGGTPSSRNTSQRDSISPAASSSGVTMFTMTFIPSAGASLA